MDDIFRREKDSNIWHFCSNCSKWPVSNYETHSTIPANDELCPECLSKKQEDECD